jgi:F-type H+-transporting ATPase subunit b
MLNVSLSGLLWTVTNLLVLYLLLKRFLWQPVTNMIESRQKEIKDNLNFAQQKSIEAAKAKEDYEAQLAQAAKEVQGLLQQAQDQGRREYQAILASAQADAEALVNQTRHQLEADRAAMIAEVKNEAAELVVLAAAQVAGRQMDKDVDRTLLEEFLDKAGAGK